MKSPLRTCLACSRPARPGCDAFCSEQCRRAFEHEQERAPGRETVELQKDNPCGAVWIGGHRLNLQNSA